MENVAINADNAAVGESDIDAILATLEENSVLIGQSSMAAQASSYQNIKKAPAITGAFCLSELV
ncbi:MAG: hypothetical protein ACI9TA_002823 [Reinekea sp.]|jgi:hypothetical protein